MHLSVLALRVVAPLGVVAMVACSSSSGGPGQSSSNPGGSSGGGGSGGSSSGGGSGGSSSSGGSSGSSGSGSSSGGTTVMMGTTWSDGMTISSNVTIAAGTTVTIAPGATINVGANVTITVDGTLTASAASSMATLTGTGWDGIVVAKGGTLSLDGVNVTGAKTAIDVQAGAASAEYDGATITGATTPFDVASGGSLGTQHANVTGSLGPSTISGSLTANYLDYDCNGNEGIETMDAQAELSVENSTVHGGQPVHDGLVAVNGAAKFHVAHSTTTDNHCGFHFDTLSEFDITDVSDTNNIFGFMFYGSGGAGPFTVTDSNIESSSGYAYQVEGMNSPITFTGCYVTGMTDDSGSVVSQTMPASSEVSGTGPQ
jgi:hypothetical protein